MKSYSAIKEYQSFESAQSYESRSYYRGFLGKWRNAREKEAVSSAIHEIEQDSVILDCPCGNGRWFESLSPKCAAIIGMDVSEGMVEYAKNRAMEIPFVEVRLGNAEAIDKEDQSVDYVFSYALMKHIPIPIQYKILGEFSRVARKGVLCSFAVLTPIAYAYWKRSRLPESFPIMAEELEFMASSVGLRVETSWKTSLPFVGLERLVRFSKLPPS